MSVGTAANWSANLIVALTFLTLTKVVGKPGTFGLYAAVTIGAWFFAYFLVPETKGKTLEQIEAHWQTGKHARTLGQANISSPEEPPTPALAAVGSR
jgi:hypothetical protein